MQGHVQEAFPGRTNAKARHEQDVVPSTDTYPDADRINENTEVRWDPKPWQRSVIIHGVELPQNHAREGHHNRAELPAGKRRVDKRT
jgi:hypothetical protein